MIFEISPDTRALADRLATVPHGSTITYHELSGVIGRDINKCRHLLYSAMDIARKEVGAVFGVVVGKGYERITLEKAPAIGHTARRHIRHTARQASKKMAATIAKANDVPNDVRLRINTELSALGLVEHMSQDRNVKPRDSMQNAPEPVAKAAKAFLEIIGATKES